MGVLVHTSPEFHGSAAQLLIPAWAYGSVSARHRSSTIPIWPPDLTDLQNSYLEVERLFQLLGLLRTSLNLACVSAAVLLELDD